MASSWTTDKSRDLYLINRWGKPYFDINKKGNLTCCPNPELDQVIDIKALVDDLHARGIEAPIIIRFNEILKSRIATLSNAFAKSIEDYGYKNRYRPVMPIKVNQQRHVVEEQVSSGQEFGLGLECGSKPELLVAIALLGGTDELLICNGYKDGEYIELALWAQKLGLNPHIVVDRFEELDLILQTAQKIGVEPNIGIRAKLSAKGTGKWQASSGDRSKFGLTTREMVHALDVLRDAGKLDCLKLLHFHIGSQITAIRAVKSSLREAAHTYSNLVDLGATNIQIVDVGGGLAVDYDGSQTNFHASMNYSTQEYANDVVSTLMDILDERGCPHPMIISESGRALVAHHSALIFNVLGANQMAGQYAKLIEPNEDDHTILHQMYEAYASLSKKNVQEIYNDAVTAKEESVTLYSHGVLDLKAKAQLDDCFWAILEKIQTLIKSLSFVPEDLQDLGKKMSDTYFCNFSLFQSLPDSWAIDHLFPITPIHRLNEEPTREAVLADLTCDSDGKIDQFIDLENVRDTIRLHELDRKPYYLGAFLVGAYQETLGDLHNLFGDTHVVHVSLDKKGKYRLEHLVQGDTVEEVLSYVEYDKKELVKNVRKLIENAVDDERITLKESAAFMRQFKDGMAGYTYLED